MFVSWLPLSRDNHKPACACACATADRTTHVLKCRTVCIFVTHSTLEASYNELEQGYFRQKWQCQEWVKFLEEEKNILAEQVHFFKARLFGRKSEQLTTEELHQILLFDEATDIHGSIVHFQWRQAIENVRKIKSTFI
ncbi:MAG: transposase [Thermodesulfobacteriota bacterium]